MLNLRWHEGPVALINKNTKKYAVVPKIKSMFPLAFKEKS